MQKFIISFLIEINYVSIYIFIFQPRIAVALWSIYVYSSSSDKTFLVYSFLYLFFSASIRFVSFFFYFFATLSRAHFNLLFVSSDEDDRT